LKRSTPADKDKPEDFQSDRTILVYIHELFHCFQEDHISLELPNFRRNPDTNFAAYSEVEGAALRKAYEAVDPEEAKSYLADFLRARELRRKGIPEFDQRCESTDEVREGTAVYSEVRTLELIQKGFTPGLTPAEEPYYHQFKDAGKQLGTYKTRLAEAEKRTFGFLKCYEYGCFQALLLERLYPGWQSEFGKKPAFLDEVLARRLNPPKADAAAVQKRFVDVYGLAEVRARQGQAIKARDDAYAMLTARRGVSYIISFKKIHQYLVELSDKDAKKYEMGLMSIYPNGFGAVKFDDIEVSPITAPTEVNQLYYIKVVDTESASRAQTWGIKAEKMDGDVLTNAVLTTPLFTLKAPAIRVKEQGGRVKIWVLSRVKGG